MTVISFAMKMSHPCIQTENVTIVSICTNNNGKHNGKDTCDGCS